MHRSCAHRDPAHRRAWHDGGHVPPRAPRQPRGRVPRRARRPRPARRRAGDGRAARPRGPRARRRRHRARGAGASWRRWTASGRTDRTDLPDDDARALLAIRAAIADRFGGRRRAPGVAAGRHEPTCDEPRRLGGGDRGRRNGAPDAARGVLRRASRRTCAVDGETLSRPADPRPPRLGAGPASRRRRLFLALGAAVACGRRRRRPDVAVPRADPRVGRRLGGGRLPDRGQRGGPRPRDRRRRAMGDRHPGGVAGCGDRTRPGPRRARGRAVGLVVAGRRGGARAGRVAPARARVRHQPRRPRCARRGPRRARRPTSTPRRAPAARRSPSRSPPSARVLGVDRTGPGHPARRPCSRATSTAAWAS